MSRFTALFVLSLLFCVTVNAQFSIGTWRDHLPYAKCIDVCKAGDRIFTATPYSVFTYNNSDEEVFRISKANYLTDVGITAMEYDPTSGFVVVGYENGNVDLITSGSGFNIPDIKFSSIVGDKSIYDIYPFENKVYLSTGFGVVVLDMVRLEVKETYFIGLMGGPVRVNDLAIYQNKIYAATETGLQTADLSNPFLANFENWDMLEDLPGDTTAHHIEFFNHHMLLAMPGVDSDVVWRKDMNIPLATWEAQSALPGFKINQMWSNSEWFTISGTYGYQVCHLDFGFTNSVSLVAGRLIYAYNTIVGDYGFIWSADKFSGLMVRRAQDGSQDGVIIPEGPASGDCRRIGAYNNNVWIAHGGAQADWGNMWRTSGISGFVNDQWKILPADTLGNYSGGCNAVNAFVADFMDVAVDPLDNNRVIAGSWEEGLVEINVGALHGAIKNGTATTGPDGSGFDWAPGWTGVAGVAFDKNGTLWCTNSFTENAIHAMDRNGVFFDFDCSPTIDNDQKIGDMIIGQNGYVWSTVIGKGVLVLNTNGTLGTYSDDTFKLLTDVAGNGKLPSRDVLCLEEDLDAEVWVGTTQGLSIFYNPDAIFSEDNFDSEQILIEQDGNVQILLETEIVNCIEIDGSNRKWIGTQNSGVYLFSDDGLEQIYHFTEENSPLLANTVYDIAINHDNGEVFFATEKGVIGFFSTATNFDPEMADVRVFPNPVRPDYDGNITIDGLAYNTSVKITDIQGNIMFETESEGGRAIWNGRMNDGTRPSTGVYMVFVSTPDGSADDVKKVTFIK